MASKSDSIKTFISKIKYILAQENPNSLIESYRTAKLEQQITFQLKIFNFKYFNSFDVIEDLHLNSDTFKYMLDDFINSLSGLSVVEINDFLGLYRKSLNYGINILTNEQRLKLFDNLKTFEHNNYQQIPIRASTLYNFSVMGIENDKLYNGITKSNMQNLKATDLLQIFYAMNYNKAYYNEEFFTFIESKTQLISGRLGNLKIFLSCLDNYLLLCEQYNRKPLESAIDCYYTKFTEMKKSNPSTLHILNMNSTDRLLSFFSKFKDDIKSTKSNPPERLDQFIDFCLSYQRIFPEDQESLKSFISKIKSMMKPYTSVTYIDFIKFLEIINNHSSDEDVFPIITRFLVMNQEEFLKLIKNLLIITEARVLLSSESSILSHPLVSSFNYNVENIIRSSKLPFIARSLQILYKNKNSHKPQAQALIHKIESTTLAKIQQDPFLLDYTLKLLKFDLYSTTIPSNSILFHQLQKPLSPSNPQFK